MPQNKSTGYGISLISIQLIMSLFLHVFKWLAEYSPVFSRVYGKQRVINQRIFVARAIYKRTVFIICLNSLQSIYKV